MNKKVLGIVIPYYKNSEESEIKFRELICEIVKQLKENTILYIYEDGQKSKWLQEYKKNNIIINGNIKNKGVSYARNKGIDYLIDKVNYITFIDADDMISKDFIDILYDYCADNTHDIIETLVKNGEAKIEQFDKDRMRNAVWGVAIKSNVIGNKRFDETLQNAEDVDFIYRVVDLKIHRKKQCKAVYYYQYGVNPNSLVKRYNRKEIGKKRNE